MVRSRGFPASQLWIPPRLVVHFAVGVVFFLGMVLDDTGLGIEEYILCNVGGQISDTLQIPADPNQLQPARW